MTESILNLCRLSFAAVVFLPAGSVSGQSGPLNEPVVARVEMKLATEEKVLDVIEKGDLLTVVEVRDKEKEYVILTHSGVRGVVDQVNAVKLAESTDIYTDLIKANPEEGRYHTLRASAWWALNDPQKALSDFDTAIEKGYREAHAYSSRGLFYAATGQPEKAMADYAEALRLDPDDITPLINRAAVELSTGKFDQAVADYTTALQSKPDNVPLLRQRALAHKSGGKLDAAIADFDAILKLQPDDVAAIMGRGYVHFQRLDFRAAVDDFTAALEINDKDPVCWNNRGYNRYQLGEVKGALADYDRAIELAPKYGLALQNRAWLLATTDDVALRDPQRAIQSATAACELSDYKNISDLSALAASLAAAGKFDEAVGWQEKVVELAADAYQDFAQKMLKRYQQDRPYANDPDAATRSEDDAAIEAAKKNPDKVEEVDTVEPR